MEEVKINRLITYQLSEILERPGMYIQPVTISALYAYIAGFHHACKIWSRYDNPALQESNDCEIRVLNPISKSVEILKSEYPKDEIFFSDWIKLRFDSTSNSNWAETILEGVNYDETEAMKMLKGLLKDYFMAIDF